MMAVFKKLFDFYINSSIHVALSVYALTYITLLELSIPYNEALLYFVFYATITGYNFVKYFGLARFHHRSLANRLKIIQVFSFFCFVLMCYYGFQLPIETLLYLGVFGVITFFYAIPFLPRRFFIDKNHNFRSISGLKIYVIGFVWTGVTVFLPVLNNEMVLSLDIIISGVQRFAFVILLMLPFEIRDLKFDHLKLSTIPQKIGIKPTKILGCVLAILVFLLEFFKDEITQLGIFDLTIVLFTTTVLVLLSKINQNKYYSAFWVEGIPIYWLVLLVMFR